MAQREYHPYDRSYRNRQVPASRPAAQTNNRSTISRDEVSFESLLGKGSFGEVWKGLCRGKTVAIKILTKQVLDEKTMEEFKREVEIISNIGHSNVIQFMGACFEPGRLMIVTELIPRGDLEDMLLNKKIPLSDRTKMKMALDIALGMNWLHLSQPIIMHRDLKTKNLLVGDDNTIKICDFGLSQVKPRHEFVRDAPNAAKGTPIWMAPEIMKNENFDEKCDVYSFGLILWCLVTRQEPYTEFTDFETFRTAVSRNVRPIIPPDTLPRLTNLIQQCWATDPRVRPSFSDIIPELERIIIDYTIFDAHGREFWYIAFAKNDQVFWDRFYSAFQGYVDQVDRSFVPLPINATVYEIKNATDAQLLDFETRSVQNQAIVAKQFMERYGRRTCNPPESVLHPKGVLGLHALLVTTPKDEGIEDDGSQIVTMERFGAILQWFGPFFIGDRLTLLNNIVRDLSQPWFHGDINQEKAEAVINAANANGIYLVRFSSKPGCYTISQSTQQGIEHRRIVFETRDGQTVYRFGKTEAGSLAELISMLVQPLNLRIPCPGSKYQKILLSESRDFSGYIQSGADSD